MKTITHWARRGWDVAARNPFLSALVVLLLVVVPGYLRVEQVAGQAKQLATSRSQDEAARSRDKDRQLAIDRTIINALRADIMCIEVWANHYTSHVRNVQGLATARVDELFRALNQATKGHQAQAMREYRHAAAADRRYHRYLAKHPIPGLGLTCRILPPPIAKPKAKAKRSSAPKPRPTVTVTRTVPGPAVRIPGPTVTRRVPGPTVTITAPPGKAHRHR